MSTTFKRPSLLKRPTKTISVTSGKGGVGKTTLVANLAIYLGQKGYRVLLLDGDFGMANLDIMFGVNPRKTIEHAIREDVFLKDIIVPVAPNVDLIPGGSGVYGLSKINTFQKRILMDQVNDLDENYDYMLIDTAPGLDEHVTYLNTAAQDIMVVLTPDPSSLADAYALIKVLNTVYKEKRFSVVCNMMRDEREAKMVFQRLSDVATQFLCVSLDFRGFIPHDLDLRKATKSQQLIANSYPRSPSSIAVKHLAENLSGFGHIESAKGGLQFFWSQMIGVA